MYRLFIFIMVVAFFVACGEKQAETKTEAKAETEMTKTEGTMAGAEAGVYYYTCPMEEHKHIHSAEAGKCPECNMDLVAAVSVSADQAEYFGCPMAEHSHVRMDKAGNCPECNMELKPMALKKM